MSVLQNNLSASNTSFEMQAPGFDFARYIGAVKKHWLLVIVSLAVVLIIGLPIVLLRPAVYSSQGKILNRITANSNRAGTAHRNGDGCGSRASDRATRHDAGQPTGRCGTNFSSSLTSVIGCGSQFDSPELRLSIECESELRSNRSHSICRGRGPPKYHSLFGLFRTRKSRNSRPRRE